MVTTRPKVVQPQFCSSNDLWKAMAAGETTFLLVERRTWSDGSLSFPKDPQKQGGTFFSRILDFQTICSFEAPIRCRRPLCLTKGRRDGDKAGEVCVHDKRRDSFSEERYCVQSNTGHDRSSSCNFQVVSMREQHSNRFSVEELARVLEHFYVEVRRRDGENYRRTSLGGIRAAFRRHLSGPDLKRTFNILTRTEFGDTNLVLNAHLKQLSREGKLLEVCILLPIQDPSASLLQTQNIRKRTEYEERIVNVDHASFSPLVFSSTGSAGLMADRFLQ